MGEATPEPSPSQVILFSISSVKHVRTFEPIVRRVREAYPAFECHVVSTAELHENRETDRELVASVFDRVYVIADYLPGFHKKLHDLRNVGRAEDASLALKALRSVLVRLGWLTKRSRKASIKKALTDLLQTPGIRCIVLANDRTFPVRQMAPMGHEFGIPSLLVQESIRKDEIMGLLKGVGRTHPSKGLNGQGGCDRIAAWGETSRQYYIQVGVPPERIVLTGNPRMEELARKMKSLSKPDARRELGIPVDSRVVLFATNPLYKMGFLSEAQYLESVHRVSAAVSRAGSHVYLIVRPHQIEYEHQTWKLDQELASQERVLYLKGADLASSIAACDAVIVFNSTVAVEAALFERDVAVINDHRIDLGVNFGQFDFAVELTTDEELLAYANGDYPPHWEFGRAHVDDFVTHLDDSTELIVSQIIDLASRGGSHR
jgi:hypothetical protein